MLSLFIRTQTCQYSKKVDHKNIFIYLFLFKLLFKYSDLKLLSCYSVMQFNDLCY
jgi:hypothetical protein